MICFSESEKKSIKIAYLVFDVFTLFFVSSVINGFVNWFANSFWVVMAYLVWHGMGYWVAYFFGNIVTFGFVFSFVFSNWVGFAYSFGNIFTLGGVGGVINSMAFNMRFGVNQRSSTVGWSRMVGRITISKPVSIRMMPDAFSSATAAPGFSISFGFGKCRRQKNAQSKKNLDREK